MCFDFILISGSGPQQRSGKTVSTSSYRRPQPTSASPSHTGHPELWKQPDPKGTRKSRRCQHANERSGYIRAHSQRASERGWCPGDSGLGRNGRRKQCAAARLGADTGSQASGEQAARPGRSALAAPRAAFRPAQAPAGVPRASEHAVSLCAQRGQTGPPARVSGGQRPPHPNPTKES